MAKMRANPTVIGAFVLGALGLVATAVIMLGGAALFTPKVRAVAFFDGSVNGLDVGAAVNFRGVRVGSVDKIVLQFDANTLNARIPVFMTLLPTQIKMIGGSRSLREIPFESFLDKGMSAKLNMESIVTGQLSVDLDFRPKEGALRMGTADLGVPEIPTVKSDFDVLKDQLSQVPFRQLADDVKVLVESLQKLTQGSEGALSTLDQQLQDTGATARRTLETATTTLVAAQHALNSVQRTSDQAGKAVAEISPVLQQTLLGTQQTLQKAQVTLAKADTALSQTTEMTAPGTPLRTDLEQTARDLSAAAESLREFAETVDRRPNVLMFGKD